MEPLYLAIVNNEMSSDGSGFVVITKDNLEDVVQDVLTDRIKEDIENELFYYEEKDPSEFDYSRVPEFVNKHTEKTSDTEYLLRPEEEDYQRDLDFTIEDNPGGLVYNVDIHDIKNIPQGLKSQLNSLEPNKFTYLHEMDPQLELGLKKEIDIFY